MTAKQIKPGKGDTYTFLDCPKRHYFGFLDCYMAGCRADLIIDCTNQREKYGCPGNYP